MLTKTEGIILQNTRYADRRSILKIFTRQYGLVTFTAVKGKSPSSKVKAAAMMPLQYVELSFNFKQNQDVQQLAESSLLYIFDTISKEYNKLASAQFINEVLVKCIREQHPNEELFDFIIASYKWFNETEKGHNNFHICFLIELSKYLGFEPHNNYSEHNTYFDTREGKFTPVSLGFPLGFDKQQSLHFLKIFDANLLTAPLTRSERNELLECLLAYYKMHVAGFNELRSYRVLKEMFDEVQ
jgi:DNA repair protein RecO (recombination protein O)